MPATLDDDDAWGVVGMARVAELNVLDLYGHADLADDPAVSLAYLLTEEYAEKPQLIAVPKEGSRRVLGAAFVTLPLKENTDAAWINVVVDPAERRRGIGRALWEAAARDARARGRTQARAWTDHRTEPKPGPGAIEPPTGYGRVAADDAGAVFAQAMGFSLAQVERKSLLDVPVDPALLERLETEDAASAGYRLVTWQGATPPERLEQVATMRRAMSEDIPQGDAPTEAQRWDAERVATMDAAVAAGGVVPLTCAAEEISTGRLVGYTELAWHPSRPESALQEDTLVMREHRGHRLGLAVKVGNLRALMEAHPSVRRVHTWNAEENRHMLSINEALGFQPDGVNGAWIAAL